jgi:hypothetical protein
VLLVGGLLLLAGCFPFPSAKSYGFVYKEVADDGSYNCRFVNIESTFAGEPFGNARLDAEEPMGFSKFAGGVPGFPVRGDELVVKLDCVDESGEPLSTTVYELAVSSTRVRGNLVIWNFVPVDRDPGECLTPTVQTGEPMFCAVAIDRGFTPIARTPARAAFAGP